MSGDAVAAKLDLAQIVDDRDIVRYWLATRDIACPKCRYNLRGLDGVRCPECDTVITFSVSATDITTLPFILSVMCLSGLLAIDACACLLLTVLSARTMGHASSSVFAGIAVFFGVACALVAIGLVRLVRSRAWFTRQPIRRQRGIAWMIFIWVPIAHVASFFALAIP